MNNKVISDVMLNVLSDAISAITILEVENVTNIEGTSMIYIKTDNLSTVDSTLLDELTSKNSTDEFKVTYLIPESKFINKEHKKNEDTVCIFIEKVS